MEQVDIIMPAYNCEKYIKHAITSVKSQTYQNWKLIIINDNSTDDTIKEIRKNIEDIKEKVILIEAKEHIGVAKARNLGIEKGSGRYIAFLDSDDIWKENKLEKQIEFMKKNNYEFTYTLYTYLKKEKEKKVKYFTKSLNYQQALGNTFILTSTVVLDTKWISNEKMKMPNIESEDTATWWKILKEGKLAYGLEENLTIYRVTNKSLSANKLINLKKTWKLYREQEKLSIGNSLKYFVSYILHAIIKRIK